MKPRVLLIIAALVLSARAQASGDLPIFKITFTIAPPKIEPVPPAAYTDAELSSALLAETNRVRAAHGLRVLAPLPALAAAADDQASFMALTLNARHDCPIRGQQNVRERVQRHGFTAEHVAENVLATGFAPPPEPPPTCAALAADMIAQWLSSPGHRANILNPEFTHAGCGTHRATFLGGTVGYYSAQVFAAR